MKNKKMIMILVLIIVTGFASVSATLFLNGAIEVSSNASDFKVIFTKTILDDVERKDFIKGDKKIIDFVSNELKMITDTTTLDYEVTNTSRIYDAEVSIACNIVDNEGNETRSDYISMGYSPNEMTIKAGETKSGSITATLIKSSIIDQEIRVQCELNATATERTSLGNEYKEAGKYELITDDNKNGVADQGEEIAIGEEHFYVLSNNNTEINALAKYNLNVGSYANPNVPEGIQDETVKGMIDGDNQHYGTIPFSSETVKGTNYTDYSGSIVEGYVNNYIAILNNNNIGLNVTGRLISVEELLGLGCSGNTCSGASKWVYSTSYWSGSPYNTVNMWTLGSNAVFLYNGYYHDTVFGVRPVITITNN